MATAEFVEEMAAGQQTAVQPYMFEPESDPEQQDAPEESQQPRMNMDVSQCLFNQLKCKTDWSVFGLHAKKIKDKHLIFFALAQHTRGLIFHSCVPYGVYSREVMMYELASQDLQDSCSGICPQISTNVNNDHTVQKNIQDGRAKS
ncbi:hypothetical protein ABVT39_013847 [Epinephelus coioides]